MKKNNYYKLFIALLVLGALLLTAFTGQLAYAKFNSSRSLEAPAPISVTASKLGQITSLSSSVPAKSSSQDSTKTVPQASSEHSSSEAQSSSESETEITGTITSISGDMWTINGVIVIVNSSTEIENGVGVGSVVKVEGQYQADGTFLAHEIEPASGENDQGEDNQDENDQGENEQGEDNQGENESSTPPQAGSKVEFSGQLTAINGDVWTVGGVSVIVTSSTEISGSPVVGDMVKVEGTVNSNGSVQASEVKLSDASDSENHHGDESSSSTSSSSHEISHSSSHDSNNQGEDGHGGDDNSQGDGGD